MVAETIEQCESAGNEKSYSYYKRDSATRCGIRICQSELFEDLMSGVRGN